MRIMLILEAAYLILTCRRFSKKLVDDITVIMWFPNYKFKISGKGCVFRFLRYNMYGKHLMFFQTENTLSKFFRSIVDDGNKKVYPTARNCAHTYVINLCTFLSCPLPLWNNIIKLWLLRDPERLRLIFRISFPSLPLASFELDKNTAKI